MDATKFDRFAESMAGKRTRRDLVTGILGLAAAASAGAVVVDGADAARRGFSGPSLPGTAPGPCTPTCPEDSCGIPDGCGGVRSPVAVQQTSSAVICRRTAMGSHRGSRLRPCRFRTLVDMSPGVAGILTRC